LLAALGHLPSVTPEEPLVTFSPYLRLGLIALVATLVLDQAVKLALLHLVQIETRGLIVVAPFLDLVMAWNPGISFGLFPQDSMLGQWVLIAFKAIAVGAIGLWLIKAETAWIALGLGLIAGGAVGNGIDRLLYGAVADFFAFHITTAAWSFRWYVFNLADVAIVAGVALLLYESLVPNRVDASKSS
jgi:signal peptidase II